MNPSPPAPTTLPAQPYVSAQALQTPSTQWRVFCVTETGPDVAHLRPDPQGRAAVIVSGFVVIPLVGLLAWAAVSAADIGEKHTNRWFGPAAGVIVLLAAGIPAYFGLTG